MSIRKRLCAASAALSVAAWLATLVAAALTQDIPGPPGSDNFGAAITVLPNGNLVICDPGYDAPGAADVGAVYLYDGKTGAMISALTGSAPGDQVGSGGVTVLANGNFVLSSPSWDNGSAVDAGAITWSSAVSGVSGVVSPANSLVGSASDDHLGSAAQAVVTLPNGNYLALSPEWDNGDQVDAGAVTWGNGASGVTGEISAANSLVGGSNGDRIGAEGSLVVLENGNYLALSPEWDNGDQVDAGAVTWGNAGTGVSGLISAANSLVGATAYDQVGVLDPLRLPNGSYLVLSPFWDNGAAVDAGAASPQSPRTLAVDAGAVTWGSATGGVSGVVSPANSLVGGSTNDRVGDQGRVTILSNGNYLVSSPLWDNVSVVEAGAARPQSGYAVAVDAGAVTWGSAAGGVSGIVSAANSLVGSSPNDMVGFPNTIYPLQNGNAVIASYLWDRGAITDAGAVTWVDGSLGISGVVSAANSLVGSAANDRVGSGRISVFPSNHYAVKSPSWDRGALVDAGALTYVNGATGLVGEVSAANSLVGSSAGDNVGLGDVAEVGSAGLVVLTPNWDNGGLADVGAITWLSTAGSVSGEISTANSLVGGKSGDRLGSGRLFLLSNGSYLVHSPEWDSLTASDAGAITWASGAAGLSGVLSSANSLVGSASGDLGGYAPVMELAQGNFVIRAPDWDNGAIVDAGAVVWGGSANGVSGEISSVNSLVGLSAGDRVGAELWALENGNYLVISPDWDNGALVDVGAVTWGDGAAGVRGLVSPTNSLVGASAGDRIGSAGISELYNGNYVVRSPEWDNGAASDAGAITWANGAAGITGLVSPANSLVGAHINDLVGFYPIERLNNVTDGSFLVLSPDWDNGSIPDAGAVTWVNGQTGRVGAISAANSLVGGSDGDAIGQEIVSLGLGSYLVLSPLWDNGVAVDAGAITWGSSLGGVCGVVSSANSLVGSSANDNLGAHNSVGGSDRGDYVVLSPNWDNGGILDAGAVTWMDGLQGATTGEITAQNSLLGGVAGGGPSMTFQYDNLLGQYIIGRPAENMVSLYRQPPLQHKLRLPLILR